MVVTLPGVYHCGFSNSFNVCEAVNLATADWIESGRAFMKMNQEENFLKMTCFSLDWMVYETFCKRDTINLSSESRQIIEKEFLTTASTELEYRKTIRENLKIEEEELVNSQKIKYYDYSCSYCSNYFYLSWVGCKNCQQLLCSLHGRGCGCHKMELILFKRVNDDELASKMHFKSHNAV